MAKLFFDIRYRPQIESGEYKIETEDGFPATILDWSFCYDSGSPYICVKITRDGKDVALLYSEDGKRISNACVKHNDLIIITPEPEMSDFEKEVYKMVTDKVHSKDWASRLLNLARKEIEKEQKPAEWSEEDLQHRSWILECLADGEKKMPEYAEDFRAAYKWLKCLYPSWKPSEQEKGALRTAIHILTDERSFPKAAAQLQNILDAFEGKESCKCWKPSEEQMNSLEIIVSAFQSTALESLYNDLKKLM